MRKAIAVPEGFCERVGIHSGVISRGGFPDYGIIFAANGNDRQYESGERPLPTVGDFDPADFDGAILENADNGEEFEILGGYFFDDDDDNAYKIFGVAAQPDFGMSDGAPPTLADNWTLDEPEKPNLDEKNESSGWTFIVKPKEKEKFPLSGRPMRIWVECAEAKGIDISAGDCNEHGQRSVTLSPTVAGTPKSFLWDFGDGQANISGDGVPVSIEHFYEPGSYTAKLTVRSGAACDNSSAETDFEVEKCLEKPECPEATDIVVRVGDCDEQGRRKVTLTPEVDHMPVSFVWEFGDGQNFSGSGRPAGQDHYYSEGTYTARLTVKGSEGCEDSSVEKTFDVEKCPEKPVCPAATDIAVHVGDCDEQGRRKVTLTPKVDHLPVTFVWEFGDGQNSSGSGMPATLVHNYAAGTYTVKLTVSGGEGCEDSSVEKTFSVEKCPEKHIPPPPGICSWIMYLIEFIAALAVGTLMVHLFACPVTIWLIIFVLLTVLGIWFWYRKCDPTRCGWLQIFWVAIFAGTIVLLYLSTNGFQDTWLVALISLLIAIGIFVIWFKSCRPTAGQVFINGLLSMVAAMIVILLIATNCVGQPALPDLAVQDIDLNSLEVDCPGGPGTCITTVTFVIANSGVVDAGPFDIRILFDPDQSVVVTQSVPGLAAGASTPITITTPPGGNCYDQDCTICVTVDSGGVINESDETNNELCKTAGG